MKQKHEILTALAQTDDDRILLARVLDRLALCEERGYQTNTRFLDLRERTMTAQAVALAGGTEHLAFTGGYTDAERVAAVFFPGYLTEADAVSPAHSPLAVLRARKHAADTLAHRDYLGALMGLQITRDCVGDIILCDDGADIVVLDEIAEFLLIHFEKAGKRRLSLSRVPLDALRPREDHEEIRDASVVSMRLDSVIAAIFHLSRGEAQDMVARGQVFLNFLCCMKPEHDIAATDLLTVRGMGRARILSLAGQSRKGRQFFRYARTT